MVVIITCSACVYCKHLKMYVKLLAHCQKSASGKRLVMLVIITNFIITLILKNNCEINIFASILERRKQKLKELSNLVTVLHLTDNRRAGSNSDPFPPVMTKYYCMN